MNPFVMRPLADDRGVTLAELAVTLALFGMLMAGVMMTWSKTQEAYFVGSEAAENQQNVRAAVDFMVRELRATGRDVTICAFDYSGPTSLDCTGDKATQCAAKLGGGYSSCTSIFAIPYLMATNQQIQILSDRNDNGTVAGTTNSSATDAGEENVVYRLATGAPPCPPGVNACITRDDGTGPVAMVAIDITGLVFTYYPRPGFPPCDQVPPLNPCPPFSLPFLTQYQADNIGRIHIAITSQTIVAGDVVNRRLDTDVFLKNRF
jgi:prepilin-type N-terminal cleavage/methylation domain-containing protein